MMGVRLLKRLHLWAAMALWGLSCGVYQAQEAGHDDGRVPLVVSASDADGDTLKYEWVQTAGPKARIDEPTKAKTFFTPSEPGEYTFEIRVSDGQDTVSDRVTFVVKPPNQPPVAMVSGPQKVNFGEIIRLDGGASKDPDGKIVQYRWQQAAGPKVVLPEDKWGGPELEFKPPEAGDYIFELQVFDGKLWSSPARASCTVAQPNRKPHINLQVTKQEVDWPGEKAGTTDSAPTATTTDPKTTDPKTTDPKTTDPKTTDPDPKSHSNTATDPKSKAMPIADAGKGGAIKLGEELILDASKSRDPQGEELTYRWEQKPGEGPLLREIRHDPTSAKSGRRGPDYCPIWRCRPTEAGVYEFILEVSAGKGGKRKGLASVAYRVEGRDSGKQNRAPLLDVPAFVMGKAGQEVRIEAVVTDPENDPVDVTWTVIDPINLQIPPAALTQRTLAFTPPTKGVYVFGVVAQDGNAKCEPRQVEVKVAGSAPVISVAKPDPTVDPPAVTGKNHAPLAAILPLNKPLEVKGTGQLDGTLSSDEDGDPLTYRWQVVDGAERVDVKGTDTPHLSVTGVAPGAVKIELRVNDGKADSPVASISLEIQSGAGEVVQTPVDPPVAKCELVSQAPFLAGKPLEFSGAKSSDPAGKPLMYHWKAVGENAGTLKIPADAGERLTVKPEAPGDYTVELRVGNGESESEGVSVTFNVEEAKRKPVAVIAPITPCEPGGKITLDASPSQNARGKSLSYRWSCVTNPPDSKVSFGWSGAKRVKTEIVLPKPGEYVFELKVTEDDAESDPVRVTVQTRAPNQPPQASFIAVSGFQDEDVEQKRDLFKLPYVITGETLTVEEGWPVMLDASGSKDPDGGPQPLTFKFKHISGPAPAEAQPVDGRLRFDAPGAGTVVYEMTATDGKDLTPPLRVTLNILKAKTLPVAVPRAYVSAPGAAPPVAPPQRVVEIPVFKRMARMEPGDPVLILDGQMSTYTPRSGGDKGLRYIWKQIGGEDLQLKPEKLAKPRVGLLVYHPGLYRFMLVVNDGQYASRPGIVDVLVQDPSLGASDRPLIEIEKKDPPKESTVKGKVEGQGNAEREEKARAAAQAAAEAKAQAEAQARIEEEAQAELKAKAEETAATETQARTEERGEEEGALLPPPKDIQVPSPVAKEPVHPDRVAMAEGTNDVVLALAEPGVGPVQAVAYRPAEERPGREPLPPARPALPSPEVNGPALDVKPQDLDAVPGEITARVQRLMGKGYRKGDPIFQRYRTRAESLAIRPGPDAEDELVQMMREKDEDLRAAAALALVQRGLGSVPALIRVLEDREHPGLDYAHWSLRHLSHQSYPADAEAWQKWWSGMLSLSAP